MCNTDLHIHTCLSPCADSDMTPEAIVRASRRAGLALIAVTDHNSIKNCAAVAAEAEAAGLGFLPGIEVTTLEEIHGICLFPDLSKAASFSRWLDTLSPSLGAPLSFFGRSVSGLPAAKRQQEERRRFYMARQISVLDLPAAVHRFQGLCWPAHVEKPYNSVYSILGGWPEDLEADALELFSSDERPSDVPEQIRTIRTSNAHHLRDIDGGFPLPLDSPDFEGLRRYLRHETD